MKCLLGPLPIHLVDNDHDDNDKDHSFRQPSVNKALTCPGGQSAWAVAPPWLAKELAQFTEEKRIIDRCVPLRSLAT